MTKKIEDELNLPSLEEALRAQAESNDTPVETSETPAEIPAEIEQIANALKNIDPASMAEIDPFGTADHILETDSIYSEALKAYKDLMDLGMNIESKHAGPNAFAPAAKMLEIALKASQSKANKKLERLKAIIEREAHDREMGNLQDEGVIEGEGTFMAFRKDMIEKIRKGEI